jgi:polygalacturonase
MNLKLSGLFVLVFFIALELPAIAETKGNRPFKPNIVIVVDSTGNGFLGDGTTDNTKAIQTAIDSCYNAGGGTVEFTSGVFLTGPITLESNVTLQIDSSAALLGTTYMKAYYPVGYDTTLPMPSSLQPLITSNHATNITITGKGTIDGNGQPWWTAYNNNNNIARPRLIQLNRSQNIVIENVTLQNSPQFHVSLQYCWYVTISNVTILAPSTSPNTDGIDPATSHFVQIQNCTIDNGDDNIAVKSGNYDSSDPNAGTSNITISGCTFLHGHGVSIGSETNAGVDSMFVTNCTFNGTDNGIRIKSYRGAGGNVRDVIYKNITMTNVKYPIWISEYYPSIPAQTDPALPVTATTPFYHDIILDSVTATGGSTSNPGSYIVGLPESPIKNVILRNVNLSGKYGLEIRNATVYFQNATINVTSGSSVIYQVNGRMIPALFSNWSGGGDWSSPATWDGGTIPDSTDNVVVMNGDSVTVTSAAPAECNGLTILSNGILNNSASLVVKDSFAVSSNAFYYNSSKTYPSFPSAPYYDINGASYYVHTADADSLLGSAGYDSTFGNVIDFQAKTIAGANLSIAGVLNLPNGKIFLGGNNLTAGSVNVGSSNSYVVTDNSGTLEIRASGRTKTFYPVGTSLGYAPVWITNANVTADTFSVAANVDTTSTLSSSWAEGRVRVRWNIAESTPGGTNCTMQFGWMAVEEDSAFAQNRSGYARIFYLTDSTDTAEAGTGDYTTQFSSEPYWVSRSGITSFGTFGVGNFNLTSVISHGDETPNQFRLFQNYPNPFNPSTIIAYQLPTSSHVILKVYDVLGREVKKLVDEIKRPGDYQVKFDAGNLPSGVYFYRIVAAGLDPSNRSMFSVAKKLMVVK